MKRIQVSYRLGERFQRSREHGRSELYERAHFIRMRSRQFPRMNSGPNLIPDEPAGNERLSPQPVRRSAVFREPMRQRNRSVQVNQRSLRSCSSSFCSFRKEETGLRGGGMDAASAGGVIQPLRTASESKASASSGLLVLSGGTISATTRSRSVTKTVSPRSASRTYSLSLFFRTLSPTAFMGINVVSGSYLSRAPRKPMTRDLLAFLVVSAALVFVQFAEAQQAKKVPRIGILSSVSPSSTREVGQVEAFRQGLRELGYIEGKNIVIEYRYAEGVEERLPNLAAELVQLNVDVIFVNGTTGTQAAKRATKTIPIVMTSVTDPLGTGLVASLAHPGGNVTGLSNFSELGGKQLELLKEAFPRVTRIAIIWDPANAANARLLEDMKLAAGVLRITLQFLEVRSSDDFDRVFSAIKKEHAGGLIVLRNVITFTYPTRIVEFTAKSKLPASFAALRLMTNSNFVACWT